MLKEIVKNLYCDGSFANKVEASMKLSEIGATAREIGCVEFKKNKNLERTALFIDKFECDGEVAYVATDFRKDSHGERKYISETEVVKFFVKKTLLKSCSCWSFKDEEFRRAVENYMDNM